MNEEITQDILNAYTSEQEYKEKVVQYIAYNILKYRDTKIFEDFILNKLSKFTISYYDLYYSLIEKTEELEDIINYFDDNNVYAKINSIIQCITKKHQTYTYAGSYIIKNKNNGMIYLGESIDIFQRITQHISDLYNGLHHNAWLQQDFNETHCINNFEIKPLYIYDIGQKDKNEAKHDTLYIEAAYFISFVDQGIALYNTADPYEDLKNNKINLTGYRINHTRILQLLYNDEHCIMEEQLRNRLRNNLKEVFPGTFDTNTKISRTINPAAVPPVFKKTQKELKKEKDEQKEEETHNKLMEQSKREMAQQFLNGELDTSNLDRNTIRKMKQYIKDNNITDIPKTKEVKPKQPSDTKLYRRNEIYDSLSKDGFLPEKYDHKIISAVLAKNGLLFLDENNRTVATDYSLSNKYFILSKTLHHSDGTTSYQYYISDEGKFIIEECIKSHPAEFYILTKQN